MSEDIIVLDEFGMAVWRHKTNKNLFVQRSYGMCDRVIIIDETFDGIGRNVVNDTNFGTFDFTDWIPMTKEEYSRVINEKMSNYKELYKV